jgi:hypothetical protein
VPGIDDDAIQPVNPEDPKNISFDRNVGLYCISATMPFSDIVNSAFCSGFIAIVGDDDIPTACPGHESSGSANSATAARNKYFQNVPPQCSSSKTVTSEITCKLEVPKGSKVFI